MRAVLAVAAVLAVLLPGAPAWAHAQLVASDPAKDATLATAPAAITLGFSERLNPDFTTIVLSDAAKQRVPASAPAVEGGESTITPAAPLRNGAYTVAYRVVSVDGHTVQGSYAFTVADPALPATPAATAAPAPVIATPADGSDGVPPGVLIGLGGLGVLLAAGAVALYMSGRRRAASKA